MDDPQPRAISTSQSPTSLESVAPTVRRHKSIEMERAYLRALVGPEFRPVLGMVAITVGVGTIFYRFIEGWNLVDAMYFSVVTLATIGYGDLTPETSIGKIFTIGYVFAGVGILGLFLSAVASSSTERALQEHASQTLGSSGARPDDDRGPRTEDMEGRQS